jgi:hypothetical protein
MKDLLPYTRIPTFALTSPEVLHALIPARTASASRPDPFGDRSDQITDALKSRAFSSLGTVPRQELQRQIKKLPLSSEDSASAGATAANLMLGALQRLADRFLEWRGDRVFLVDGRRLEFQALLGHVLPEQIAAASSVLLGPAHSQDDPDRAGRDVRSLPSRRQMKKGRKRAKNQPLIPTPAGTYLRKLRKDGLPELHRHHNGSTYPLLMWPDILESAGDITEHVRTHDVSVEFRSRIEAITGASDQYLSELVYRVLDTTQRLRADLLRYVDRAGEDRDGSSEQDDENRDDTSEQGDEDRDDFRFESTLRALRDRRVYLDLVQQPVRRTRPISEYISQAAGKTEHVEGQAQRERHLLVELVYRLAADWSQRGSGSQLEGEDPEGFAIAACSYLILQNRLLNALVQPADDAEGLARFVFQFFDHPFREKTETQAELRFEQASKCGAVDWLEIRQSPSGDPLEKLRDPWQATESLREGAGDEEHFLSLGQKSSWKTQRERVQACLQPDPDANSPGIGTIFHFIRRRAGTDGYSRWNQVIGSHSRYADRFNPVRRELVGEAYALRDATRHPILSDLFVGLDVAALETDAPVGVFAPAIRWLRSLTSSPSQVVRPFDDQFQKQHVSPLGVTCHAGEDFRHLLGGIRSVDESVDFLQMHQGDRIGHGLALGVDPEKWAQRMGGSVTMKVGRRLFELIWFYDKLRDLDDFASTTEQVRSEIQRLCRQIYPSPVYPSPDPEETEDVPAPHATATPSCEILDASRRFQKFDPCLVEQRHAIHPYARFGRREIDEAKDRHGQRAYDLWIYHMTNRSFAKRGDEKERFAIRTEWFDAIRAVQRAVLDKMTRREVAIEVNPTSNRAIGGFDSLSQHPVFDWDPPSRDADHPRPYVVVGSDDPGVFGSELLHEYAFLHAAARHRGHDRAVVEDWLEELRANGLRFLFMQEGRR